LKTESGYKVLAEGDPLFMVIENLDYDKDFIEIGWTKMVNSQEVYKDYYNAEKNRFEFTLGFRVWNPWRIPAADLLASEKLLFDVVLEENQTCTTYEPVFGRSLREE